MRRALAAVVLSSAVAIVAPASGADAAEVRPVKPATIAVPCPNEDGSSFARACFWDGQHMGNGRGSSFLVTRDTRDRQHFHPLSHAGAHALFKAWRASRCSR